MGDYFYSQIIEAKDKSLIPLCKNTAGQEVSLHSKYNPVREAEGFAAQTEPDCLFFVILGLAGGYHIQKILEKCSKAKILAVEISQNAIEFLSQIPCAKNLEADKRVTFTSLENLEQNLLAKYKPAIHGNLTILSLRQWENIFQTEAELAKAKITGAIKLLASDFSVQSHFGKIWQKNIFTNLKLSSMLAESANEILRSVPTEKTAAIIAAGPTLDETQTFLLEQRADFFIIATDTAYTSLVTRNITPDAVVSV
ncbi:MAG: motility associated factor glycosyltransferase family protein, partial [Treponema sp.]|nr:motility associated factor glycosyltransferase family protein [Treponema sp.]